MLARRIIACLDVAEGKVVKGVQFKDHRVMGEIEELAQRYTDEGIDELVFYDIKASPEGRSVDTEWIRRVASRIDIPFCVAGGIRDRDTAQQVLMAGADKVSINTPALENPELINQLADEFGNQCVVVGIDSVRRNNRYEVKQNTGDPDKASYSNRLTEQWLIEAQQRGAGEIVLNCMDTDGVRSGFDIKQLSDMRSQCSVPLIASGGAGNIQHFADAFNMAQVDGALAATVFHSRQIIVKDLKQQLIHQQICVRP